MRNMLFVALLGLVAALLIGCNGINGKVTLPVNIPDQAYNSQGQAPIDGSVFQGAPVDVSGTDLWTKYSSHIKSIDQIVLTGTVNNQSNNVAKVTLYVSDNAGLSASDVSQMTYLTDFTVAAGTQSVNKTVVLNDTINNIIRDGKFSIYGFGTVTSNGTPQPVNLTTTNMVANIGVTVNVSVN